MAVIINIVSYGVSMVREKVPGDIRDKCVHSSHYF